MSVRLVVLVLLLSGCGGGFNPEDTTEACQQTLADEIQPESGVTLTDAIHNFLACEDITWADLIRGVL